MWFIPTDGSSSLLTVPASTDNMDLEIAVDAMELARHYDHLVLFLGDGDCTPLFCCAST